MIKVLAGGAGGGGGASILAWADLPAAAPGAVTPATVGGVPITAKRGAQIYYPAYPTKAQLNSLWPASDQSPGVRIGPMRTYHQSQAEQVPIKFIWQGDSTVGGQGATAGNVGCRVYSHPKLLADQLGWRDGMAFSQMINNSDPRISQGGWNAAVMDALGGAWQASGGGQNLVFTPGIACDRIIVTGIAVFSGGGSTGVYVDDVLVGTLNHSSSVNGGYALPQVTVTVTRGTHVIRCTSDSADCWVNSFETFDSLSTAIEFYQCGVANARLTHLLSTQGGYGAANRIPMIDPHLGIVTASINDLANDDSISLVKTRMTAIRDLYRSTRCEFMGMVAWATNRPSITKAKLDELYDHLVTLGQADGTAAGDARGALGYTFAETDPANYVDDDHYSQAGNVAVKNHYIKLFQ